MSPPRSPARSAAQRPLRPAAAGQRSHTGRRQSAQRPRPPPACAAPPRLHQAAGRAGSKHSWQGGKSSRRAPATSACSERQDAGTARRASAAGQPQPADSRRGAGLLRGAHRSTSPCPAAPDWLTDGRPLQRLLVQRELVLAGGGRPADAAGGGRDGSGSQRRGGISGTALGAQRRRHAGHAAHWRGRRCASHGGRARALACEQRGRQAAASRRLGPCLCPSPERHGGAAALQGCSPSPTPASGRPSGCQPSASHT